MFKLTKKSQEELQKTIIAFFEADGEECSEVEAKAWVKDTMQGRVIFEVWDALGCDQLNLVAENPQLKTVYLALGNSLFNQRRVVN